MDRQQTTIGILNLFFNGELTNIGYFMTTSNMYSIIFTKYFYSYKICDKTNSNTLNRITITGNR